MRKRHERDLAQAHKYALERIARQLLDVVDSLERGLEQASEEGESVWRTGMELTLKQLQAVLEKFEVKPVNPLGQAFDPSLHEAMSMQVSTEAPGTVIGVLQKGYQLHDRLLRPALVVTAKAAS
jgi:molecular chaperone GrpE